MKANLCQNISLNLRTVAFIIIAEVIFFIPQKSFAGTTGILEGKVSDQAAYSALINVNVRVLSTVFGTITNEEGFYHLNYLPPGTYDVQFSLVGYETVVMKNITIFPDRRTHVDVPMKASAVELKPVEIVAKRPLIQKDQPETAFSIADLKLEALPVTTFQEVLTLQPGTTLEGNVRGGKTTEVVYLVDGLPVQDVISGGLGIQLPKNSITSMTIYTGGFDAEFGNALSGVVNVVTKSGDNETHGGIRYERDKFLPLSLDQQVDRRNEAEAFIKGPIVNDKLYYFTSNQAAISDTRWWQDMQYFFPSPVSRKFSGLSKIDYTPSPNTRLTLQGIYSMERWRDYEFSWRYNLAGLPARATDTYRIALILSKILSDNSAFTVSFSRYYNRSHVGPESKSELTIAPYQYDFFLRYIVSGNRNWWAETRQQMYTLKGDYTSQLNPLNLFKAGFEINQYNIFSDLIKYEPQLTYFGKPIEDEPLLNYSNAYNYFPRAGSVYVQDRIESSYDGAILNIGLRWDFLDPRAERPLVEYIPVSQNQYQQQVKGTAKASVKQQISPRFAFAAPVDVQSMIFFNIGYYFQYPLFDYLYSGINPTQIWAGARNVLAGNPDLEPERTISWEVGYKRTVADIVAASITYFRKSTKNQIDSKTLVPFDSKSAGDFGFASYVNDSEADATGIEVVASRESGERITGSISYTYMVAEGMSETVNQAINLAEWGFPIRPMTFPLSWDQRHSVKIDGNVKLPWNIQSNLIILFNSARPYTYFPTRDGFTPIDSTKDFVPNNARMQDVTIVNLKMSRKFMLNETHSTSATVYIDMRNLFNAKNVRWIDSNGRIGGELGDPSAYYEPRRVRMGVVFEM